MVEGVDFLVFCSFFVFFHGEVNNIILNDDVLKIIREGRRFGIFFLKKVE
jgi:hypothetical protein